MVLEVVFGLEVAGDESVGIPDESDLEGHAGGRGGLDVESGAVNGEVLAKEVVGGLSEVLNGKKDALERGRGTGWIAIPSRKAEQVGGEPFGFS